MFPAVLPDIIPDHLIKSLSAALAILTSMITPALLISACGTFILSTSNRLGRVIDRVRVLSDKSDELMKAAQDVHMLEERRQMLFDQMDKLSTRAQILAKSLTVFYIAAGVFVATSVAIGVVSVFEQRYAWFPVVLGLIGALFLFYGSMMLIVEARLAVSTLKGEMDFLARLINYHSSQRSIHSA